VRLALFFVLVQVVWLLAAGGAAAASAAVERCHINATKFVDMQLPDCGLQRAINAAAEQGGGIVALPAGTFPLRRGLVLRDNVEIVGAGMDKTILTPARKVIRLDVIADSPKDGKVFLKEIPPDLEVGSAVVAESQYPPSWYGSPRPAWVTAVDRETKTVTLEAPYGLPAMKAGMGYLVFGDTAALERSVKKGDTEIVLKNANLFRPGDELAIGEPPNESMLAHAFVREVRGNTLVLEEPARIDFEAWPDAQKIGNTKINALIFALFPMVHGANVKNAAVRDLTVQGHSMERIRTMQSRYTLSGVHLFNAINCRLERVAVRNWHADGISIQTGDRCTIADCEATGNLGNGLHPGTGLTNSVIERCLSSGNGAGCYFCWHNRGHILRDNRFVRNRGGGITGLGNPGDRNNTVENNLIAENGGPGIEINGGQKSGNIIRNNLIENNSQAAPGKHPGIALYASVEDARNYTITGNTIRDTQANSTQWVGIEEKNGKYRDKPTYADENIIRGNRFSGHKTADIVIAGAATVCEDNGEAKVVKNITPEATEAPKTGQK